MKKKEKPEQAKRVLRKSKGNQRLAQETETIAEIGRIISSSLNIEEVYERFAQEAKKLIEFDRIVINIINHKDRTVSVPYMSGMAVPGRQPGETFLLADSPNEEVVRIKKYLLIHLQDAGEISARYPSMLPHFKIGLRSSLRVPLISKEQVIGVLGFLSKKPKAYGERDIKLVENIGYQIAGAIANAQLFLEQKRAEEAAQRLAQETTSIAEIGRIISSTLNIDEIYERFAQEVKKLIKFDRITINIINQKENTVTMPYIWGTVVAGRQPGDVFPLTGSATGEVFKTRSSLLIQGEDEKDIATPLPGFLPNLQAGLKSTLIIPLVSKNDVIAALSFLSKRPNAYTHQDQRLAESIGSQIAGAIANAQLFTQHQQAQEALLKSEESAKRLARENETIAEIGRIISSSLNIDEVYERFAQEAKKLIELDRLSVNIINQKENTVSALYVWGITVSGRQSEDVFSLTGSATGEVFKTRSSLIVQPESVEELEGRFSTLIPTFRAGLRSMMTVPLISRDEVIGALHFRSKKSKAYTELDLRLAERIGTQIAGAIANAQLFLKHKQAQEALLKSEDAAKRLAQENKTIAEIGRIISSTLDIDEIYERFAQEVKKLIEFDRISINHINPKENTSIILFTWGTTVSGRQSREFFPLAGSATGEVLKARASLIIQPDDEKDIATRLPAFLPVLQAGLRSTMAVPLISKGEMIAALFFYSKRPKAYTDQDLKLAESIGYQIAGAIANAQLFLEHKRAEEALRKSEMAAQRLAQENAIIAEVGRIIGSTLDTDRVYELFAEEVNKVIPFDWIAITVIDHEKGTFHNAYRLGCDIPGRQLREVVSLVGSFTEEVMHRRSSQLIQTDDGNEVAGRFPKLSPFWQRGFRSFIAVPLISHDQVIGVLHIYSLKSQAYKEADVHLAENIGSQIAGAIANALLFAKHKQAQEALLKSEDAAKRLAQENETIAEIGRIISSTLNIDEIYERFAREVKKLIEFDRLSVNIIKQKENVVTIPYIWGTTVSGRQPEELFPLTGSATEEVYKTRSSLIIQGEDENEISAKYPTFLPNLQAGLRSTIIIPLISKDEVIAAIGFLSKRPNAYTNQDLRLAESIGYQIAGAIANVQLFLEHKRDQEALRESEWRFRIAAENASDLIWEWDIGKEVLTWFGHIDEKLGYQPGEFPRTIEAWENVIHPEDHDRVMKALDRHLENQERYREEYRVLRKDGTILYWIDSGTAVYDPGGKPYKMIGSVTDITERKKMEEELLRSKKLESVGFLSGGIAHDFNNLLTGIMGNISLAKLSACPGDKILTYLENAENLSVRSSELTKKLLTFSKGGAPIKKPVLIGDFLKETARMPLSGSNVRCEFKIAEDLWPVEIDEGQMRQVIYNIVINACEAMPGGGTINILAENIIHGPADRPSLKDGKYVKLSIKDQGAGIPPENLSKIFDPYFSTKEMGSQKGMGLGLAISHSIIKNHGGFIVAESIVGNGSTFHIYLPVSSKEFLPAKEVVKKPRLGKVRILVMDDEQVVRYISGEFLKHLGYEVELAEDGAEAVARYKKAQESQQPFDIVILDLIVPGGMGGKEVLEKLLEISPDVQAIVSSGYSNDPIFSDFKRYGFKGVIAKPFDLEGLSESVSKVIKMSP